MYKIVLDYIDKLNKLAENTDEFYFDECEKGFGIQVRDSALELLNSIYAKYGWNEEFITAFAVYCNFFILHGLHMSLDNDFGLERFYGRNEMDADDRQYLEYIRYGIFEQDVEHFANAINIGLYNFDIPKLYIYVLSFLELCSKEEEDFETAEGKEDIIVCLHAMECCKEEISGELKELVEPFSLTIEEEIEKSRNFSILLPEIVISSNLRRLSLAAMSDLEMLSNLCGNKIESFFDILEGFSKIEKEINAAKKTKIEEKANYGEEKRFHYLIFANEFIRRILSAEKIGDEYEYIGKDIEDREKELIVRRSFLNLPVYISDKEYRNLALAEQIKLNVEKDILIKKNEKMVEDYSHSVENIIKPALITEVANCLRDDEKNRELYSKIMYIYFNEVITQNECRLLKMVHNVSVSKGAIRENISKSKKKNSENGISIKKMVYKAINQLSLQLVENSQKARFMFILEKMSLAGINPALIDNKLWVSSEEMDAVYQMYNEKLGFQVDISEDLERIELNEEEVGTSFLYTRIVEVITNAMTYGDYGIHAKFHLKMFTEIINLDHYIVIEMLNKIGDRSFSENRGGNGLNATEVMLERINFDNPEKESFVFIKETEEGYFETKMYIDADLYM